MPVTYEHWEPILIFACVNAMLALGFYITLSSGVLSVGHAAIAGMSAYASAVLTTNFDWPFVAAVLVGVAIAGVVGLLLGVLTVRMNLLVTSLVTLGFGETMSQVAYSVPYLGGANSFSGIPLRTTLPVAALCLALAVYVVWRFDASRLGIAARAIRDNAVAAAAAGADVVWVRSLTFGIGGALSGLAGAISAHYTLVVSPADLGFWMSFYIQVYVIFGSSYTLGGPILGAFVLTPAVELLRFAGPLRFAVYGLVILLVLIVRPQGLLTRRPLGHPSMARAFWTSALQRLGLGPSPVGGGG